ncbi:MAG: isoaspartyl peptidase/L-asparaginase [Candidatus Nanohaloarchaea archaeon]|nr:isoaspartyl peptidase/L-asparaginase [Candidatus Nanohaloarchaea archaeon]
MEPRIIVHGGAGGKREAKDQEVVEQAAEEGKAVLDGGSALDSVERAVNVLEDDPGFNAGRGAKLQLDGTPRLEAAVMTSDLACGAITGLEEIKHAVSVARAVMEETHHVMLGNGFATRFAEEQGFEREDLRTEDAVEAWERIKERVDGLSFDEKLEELAGMDTGGTVGAVAVDADGELAAATSTGGRSPQLAGRIGDTPLIGCGTYCNEYAAVSATGIGEAIVQTTLARRCCELVEDGAAAPEAVKRAIEFLEERTGRQAGLIAVTAEGVASHHNAAAMPTARR